ncbi:MAG TPA: serine--tRNA ligase, partial [Rikenellaceae bacterium]|nr:serine--tRNA ligase [Rikenellaceae bacterium]
MLNIKLLRERPQFVAERLAVKNFDATEIIKIINELDQKRRETQTELDAILSEQNLLSKKTGALMKDGKIAEAEEFKAKVSDLKEKSKLLENEMQIVSSKMNEQLLLLPNLPHISVPSGKSAEDNVIVREGGSIPEFDKSALPHWELAR